MKNKSKTKENNLAGCWQLAKINLAGAHQLALTCLLLASGEIMLATGDNILLATGDHMLAAGEMTSPPSRNFHIS